MGDNDVDNNLSTPKNIKIYRELSLSLRARSYSMEATGYSKHLLNSV